MIHWESKEGYSNWNIISISAIYGEFLKWWYPTTIVFPTKNDHFGVFWGYHLRKHPYNRRFQIWQVNNPQKNTLTRSKFTDWFRDHSNATSYAAINSRIIISQKTADETIQPLSSSTRNLWFVANDLRLYSLSGRFRSHREQSGRPWVLTRVEKNSIGFLYKRRWSPVLHSRGIYNGNDIYYVHMGVSKNRGTPKWMIYNGKPY